MWEFEEDETFQALTIEEEDDDDEVNEDRKDNPPNYQSDRRVEDPIISASPLLLSSSPMKKVQFQVGGGTDDNDDVLPLQSLTTYSNNPPPVVVNSRAEKSDYNVNMNSGANSTLPLLPVIAEEKAKNGNGTTTAGRRPSYLHSVSMVDTTKFGAAGGASPDFLQPHNQYNVANEVYGFVEMDVLTGDGDIGTREWKEMARWIKYEENLEEGSGKWGKAHIASLSFHSLLKLRQLIERDGIIMLDVEEHDMPGVAYRVAEELTAKNVIKPDESPLLMRALLLKHKHVQEAPQWFGLKRTNTSASVASLQNLYDEKGMKGKVPISNDPCVLVRRNSSMVKGTAPMDIKPPLQRTASGNYLKPPISTEVPASMPDYPTDLKELRKDSFIFSEEELNRWMGRRDTIRRLLPNENVAGATMIMVGDFDALRKPIFVFVRLSDPQFMFTVTEIPVPVRFFSILLVPQVLEIDFVEIGRAFGALMSNKAFYELALRANGRKNLLTGINEFLDDSIVLPPGDWDNHDLLPLHVLQAKSKAIRIRRMRQQVSFIRSNDSFVDGISLIPPSTAEDVDGMGEEPFDPFKRTGRLFGGMVNDIKRRFPFYKSDFTDACNFQCFSTIVFMYFASIGLIITFAGLMGEKTQDLIGMSETLTATAIAGIFYSFVSGQPLIPMGPTGALLVFDEILVSFCHRYDLDFLPLRAWISLWLFLITLIVVAAEGGVLVKWFTKFTQDIFAALTALLLIFESIDNLTEIYERHPLAVPLPADKRGIFLTINTTNYSLVFEEATTAIPPDYFDDSDDEIISPQPNTALLSTILMLGTFFIAYFLKEFRNSIFLGEKTRRALGDFGVALAIILMVVLDVVVTDTYTRKVKVPEGFEPSSPEKRGWFINPLEKEDNISVKMIVGSMGPAILLFILIFMTQQICELLISSKERKLRKGSGFHFDILLVAIINLGAGFFGAPWLACATVRALGHVTALTVYSKNNPPGEKPVIMKVHEQRVTNLAVSILVGCSVLLGPLLALIPMAVLFGVFLYMGVTSLAATQFFDRFSLLFIPAQSHPQTAYVRNVRTWKIHLFTIIQIACLALLWLVKSVKAISLAFPVFFILLVPIRLQLRRIYSPSEIEALDGKPPT